MKISDIYKNYASAGSLVPNVRSHLPQCVSVEETPVSRLYRDEAFSSNGHSCVVYRSDVYLLLNQKRLDRMTAQALSDYLGSSQASDDGLSALRRNVPIDRICDFVKSRYIQSPSELRSWSNYLMDLYNGEYAAAKAAVDSSDIESVDTKDDSKSVDAGNGVPAGSGSASA